MFGLITLPLVINNALLGWGKRLKSSKCWWGQCVLVMRANFRICGNESHPGLQIVEKVATPLVAVTFLTSDESSFKGWWWGGGGVGYEYESKRTLTRTKWLQVKTFRERDSGEGEQREVAVETRAHGRKLILAAKKKRSKQNEITMNRLLLWKNVFFPPSLPQSKQVLAKITSLWKQG